MKLYAFPVAPNPTRVRLYLAEKRAGGAHLDLVEQTVDLRAGEQRQAEHRARNALPDACRLLDATLADDRPFVTGDRPTIADRTLAAGLRFGRFGGIGIDPAFEHLARWDRAYRQRDAVKPALSL